jgi:hypothetical protein
MCESCFDNNRESFASEKEYKDFDRILTEKLGNGDMQFIEALEDDGEFLYVCSSCDQKWKLKDPDGGVGGYFIRAF